MFVAGTMMVWFGVGVFFSEYFSFNPQNVNLVLTDDKYSWDKETVTTASSEQDSNLS